MKKRLLCLALALLLLAPAAARGGETPEWAYPLKPEILQDIEGYIVLTNRECLLDSGYEPEDLLITGNPLLDSGFWATLDPSYCSNGWLSCSGGLEPVVIENGQITYMAIGYR